MVIEGITKTNYTVASVLSLCTSWETKVGIMNWNMNPTTGKLIAYLRNYSDDNLMGELKAEIRFIKTSNMRRNVNFS